jgi:hypothetical protein
MALFGSGRDASLVRSINRERVNKVMALEVELYKLSREDTRENIYREAPSKVFYNATRLNCIVKRGTKETIDTDFGLDFERDATFYFLRDDLLERDLVIEPGDYVFFDMDFYELNNVFSDNAWFGRNPETYIPHVLGEESEFGYNISVIAQAHLSRKTNLTTTDYRSGINDAYDELNKY